MDGSGLVVLVVGLVLCFMGVRSVHIAVLASGFVLGWLVTEPFETSILVALLIAVAAAAAAWVLVTLVFRTAVFFVGAIAGGVIGAKLFGVLEHGGNVVLAVLFVAAAAFIVGLAAQRFRGVALEAACALGGSGLALSGVARTFPDTLGFLRVPGTASDTVVAVLVWVALAVGGWFVQRRYTRHEEHAG